MSSLAYLVSSLYCVYILNLLHISEHAASPDNLWPSVVRYLSEPNQIVLNYVGLLVHTLQKPGINYQQMCR